MRSAIIDLISDLDIEIKKFDKTSDSGNEVSALLTTIELLTLKVIYWRNQHLLAVLQQVDKIEEQKDK